MCGFVKLHRNFVKWGWYSDANTARVFIHMLICATYQEGEYLGYKLQPGDLIFGRKKWAVDLGISEQSIRTALKHLKSTSEVTIRTNNKFSIISITNWSKYQLTQDQSTSELTNKQPTTNQQLTTFKKLRRKEVKNNIYTVGQNPDNEEIVNYLNAKTGKSFRVDSKETMSLIKSRLSEKYTVNDFKKVIDNKYEQWNGDEKMSKFLRPETLFSKKFEGYLNESGSGESSLSQRLQAIHEQKQREKANGA